MDLGVGWVDEESKHLKNNGGLSNPEIIDKNKARIKNKLNCKICDSFFG